MRRSELPELSSASDKPALDPKGRVHTFCHAVPGRWHVMGVTQGAGLSLRWFRDQFGGGADDARDPYERLTEEAARIPPAANGLIWTPYLMGERTPHLDPHARAALVGLTANRTRAHVVRAILEGVAFSLRDTFEIFKKMNVPVGEIRLGGGGARSELWRQIQADVYGRDLRHSYLCATRNAGNDQTRRAPAEEKIASVRVVFHIISTGGGSGTSRTTRYIAERWSAGSRIIHPEKPGGRGPEPMNRG